MTKSLLFAVVLLLAPAAFAVTFIPLRGDIEVKTALERRSAVVTVAANETIVAQFCVSFAAPLKRAITLSTRGEVVYLPKPMEGVAPGENAGVAEPIAQTLTVIPENGKPIAFVAKGVKPIVPESEVILIQNVSRRDLTATSFRDECGRTAS